MENIFQTYIVGLFVNLVAGLLSFFLITKLFSWLPTSADLHEKFRAVATKKTANERIAALTPLIFISFYWLFIANMLWILIYVVIEVLNWPDLLLWLASPTYLNSPTLASYLEKMMPGLTIGRSVLFIFLAVLVAYSFLQGLRIARQCWDVYKTIEAK